ncbi:MAG: hypothetical protein CMA31_02715 [Euryarchaeota archaeon]|nr:hypothetical protein [Euryarchaeota archaeon]
MSTLNKISENLFAKIRGRFPSITLGDETGVVTDDPQLARYFDFDFKDGEETLGKVSITISEDSGVTVTFNNDFVTNENEDVKNRWYDFLKEIRVFAKKNMLNFDTRDITKSNLDKRDYAHLTKTSSGDNTMRESTMYGTSRTSYEDVGTARLVLKHNQAVNHEIPGSRTQHVHSIYIESDNGERYKYPYRHLNGARALARHVSEGGNLYDDFGKHIVGLSEELAKLRQFKTYMNRSAVMAEGLKQYISVVNERLEAVKKECLKLQRETYYKEAFEGYKQEVLEEVPEDITNSWIDELTVRSFNEELKSVFPYIYKLVNDSKKVEELNPEDLLSEKTDQSDIEGEIDWEFTGDDGETAPGTISYTAHADGDNVRVDPKSIQGGVDDENNPGRITSHDFDDGPNAWPIKDDIQDIMHQATIDANKKMATRDNERDPGHSLYKGGEEMEPTSFDPVAEYEKAISYIVGEQENSLTDGSDEDKAQAVERLNDLMGEHFPAGVNGANAIESLAGIIDDPKLQEMFRKIGQKDSDICVRPLVMKWIKAHAPDVMSQVNTGDMDGGAEAPAEVPAEAAPLDHPKTYMDPELVKKIVKQKGAERDKEKGDNKKPSERLEELIKSYYDYTTNKFPKGETAVLTAVEKEFGERSLPFAEQMIIKLFHGQDREMERIKSLAGV